MSTLSAAADAHIDASPEVVLAILRDLDGHHRRILPPAFSDFEVLHGGQGDGTLSRFKFRLGGKTTEERTLTTETNPGVIREQVVGRDMVTEFRVVDEGAGTRPRLVPETCQRSSFTNTRKTWGTAGIRRRATAWRWNTAPTS